MFIVIFTVIQLYENILCQNFFLDLKLGLHEPNLYQT